MYASGLDATTPRPFGTMVESLRSITGQAQFRFVAAAPSAGTIDVYLVTPGQPIADAAPILANGALLVDIGDALTPGSYDLFVTRSGYDDRAAGPGADLGRRRRRVQRACCAMRRAVVVR